MQDCEEGVSMSLKPIYILVLTGLLLGANGEAADAASCAAAARQVQSSTGGDLLSALPAPDDPNMCMVTVIVPASDGNPPRKITRRVPAS
ncbi:hypothetical protein [Martelella soudanensis]|uniref:hypothetical protein n=1 Tax=unclassified Martelella TaxID=2629616 RepID=UPI0015DE2123|nr:MULTISPECIES: hypothetical protein [unclassified Martelella]